MLRAALCSTATATAIPATDNQPLPSATGSVAASELVAVAKRSCHHKGDCRQKRSCSFMQTLCKEDANMCCAAAGINNAECGVARATPAAAGEAATAEEVSLLIAMWGEKINHLWGMIRRAATAATEAALTHPLSMTTMVPQPVQVHRNRTTILSNSADIWQTTCPDSGLACKKRDDRRACQRSFRIFCCSALASTSLMTILMGSLQRCSSTGLLM